MTKAYESLSYYEFTLENSEQDNYQHEDKSACDRILDSTTKEESQHENLTLWKENSSLKLHLTENHWK